MKTSNQSILANIIRIRNDKGITQASIAEAIDVDYSTYSKTESGQIKLTVDRLENIANYFNMDIIDIITYPDKYINNNQLSLEGKKQYEPKVILQIELKDNKKEQVMKLILGDNNIDIINN